MVDTLEVSILTEKNRHFYKNLKEMWIPGCRIHVIEAIDSNFGGLEVGVCMATPGADYGGLVHT